MGSIDGSDSSASVGVDFIVLRSEILHLFEQIQVVLGVTYYAS